MEHPWATEHFGFPANPNRGDTHTAHDGSGWTFQYDTGTAIWWEITRYADADPLAAYIDDLLHSRARATTGEEASAYIRDKLGWRPPRRITGPNHGAAPGYGRTVTPETGFYVGFIAELPDDSDGEQLMEWGGTVYLDEATAREELADANAWRPKWRLYRLTDITEGADRA